MLCSSCNDTSHQCDECGEYFFCIDCNEYHEMKKDTKFRIRTDERSGGPSVNHVLGFEVSAEELKMLQDTGLVTIKLNIGGRPDVIQNSMSKVLEREVERDYKILR